MKPSEVFSFTLSLQSAQFVWTNRFAEKGINLPSKCHSP